MVGILNRMADVSLARVAGWMAPRTSAAAACTPSSSTVCAGTCPGVPFGQAQYNCTLTSQCTEHCNQFGCCL
ncbi:hypothetical protein GCM10027161_80510 [Microbispora hainanensis]